MNVLSLFNGISAMHLALDRAEINYNKVYYAEIDKHANKVTEHHYPQDIAIGDVTKWREWDLDWSSIGLVGAGFPCQSWSVAGQQLGDKDERGMLFWTALEIISHVLKHNPNAKFIMENVKMKKDFEEYITYHTTQELGYVEKTLINSALVSAQNRNRYYWTNFKVDQPIGCDLLLKDVIQENPCDSLFLTEKAYAYMNKEGGGWTASGVTRMQHNDNKLDGKAKTLTANMYKGVPYGVMSELGRRLSVIECELLQTFPKNWTSAVSNTQRYKCVGNAWTVDVIAHILKFI
jgi:DNA (cytosine-5)-methyltransferase 1/DNA (cytosine-5)-methyltransferase 3A